MHNKINNKKRSLQLVVCSIFHILFPKHNFRESLEVNKETITKFQLVYKHFIKLHELLNNNEKKVQIR